MFEVSIFIFVALLMLWVGWLAWRWQDNEWYNLYNRKLPTLWYAASYAATVIGAGFFIMGSAYAYRYGIWLLWFFIWLIFGIIVFGFFAGHLRELTKDLRLHTLPDFFKWRFGKETAKVLTVISLILLSGDIAIQLIGWGKLLESIGVMSYSYSVAITVFVVAVYLILSGFRAVIWTDYVLMTMIIILTAIITFFGSKFFHPTSEQLNIFTVPMWTTIGFFLFGLFGPFSIWTYYQRIFASNSWKTARNWTWLSGLTILLPGAGLIIIWIAAKNLFPNIDPDLAFIKIIQIWGPAIALIGSLLLWSALMSTVDTNVFVGSQIFNKDLLNRPLSRRNVSIWIVLILLIAMIISFILPSVTSVALLFLGGWMAIAPSAFFQWFMKSLKQYSVISSLIAGIVSLVLYAIIKWISPNVVAVSFFTSTLVLLICHFIGRLVTLIWSKSR